MLEKGKSMKTKEQIAEIVKNTMQEFAGDFDAQIMDCEVKKGCVKEMEGALVFHELASMEDKSLRTLGNDCGWRMTGKQAAEEIAKMRCFDLPDEDYEETMRAVEDELKKL